MNFNCNKTAVLLLALFMVLLTCAARRTSPDAENTAALHSNKDDSDLAKEILSNPDLPLVLEKAKSILREGLNAGSGYGESYNFV